MKYLRKLGLSVIFISVIVSTLAGCSGRIGATGPAGVGITGATVDNAGNLVVKLSDGSSIDAGHVVGVAGPTGAQGPAGQTGATGPQGPQGPAGAGSSGTAVSSLSGVVAQILPTLVYIDVSGPRLQGSGSGIIISNKGYILTAYHVTSGATNIEVTLSDGSTLAASYVSGASGRDYAIIKLNSVPAGLQAARLGSSAATAVGDYVVSAGFALGYSTPTFTSGIVSAFQTLDDGFKYIQTSAPINPGDSGGPLVNLKGEVIGVNDAGETFDENGDPIMDMEYCLPIDDIIPAIQAAIGS